MKTNSVFNIKRVLKSMHYSIRGLRAAFKTETSFRQELLMSIILIPLAFYFGTTAVTRALLIGSWILVIIAELMNSAIEVIIDRISEEQHILSGKAKDIGCSAVLISLINAAIIWGMIIVDKFM